ncbi:hypothetical protein QZM35_12450 [Burkholderia sp. AU45274]|uniref:hypothetical protein n=1 Tax=Burkholderia sp. AU45274 TaxID=3059205 RepID=UPI0026549C95|nr:hypothetical protein [Burkholderia sp. AU45274]MDN7488510.1 hypothetical protein [Burkholderia sp. AU45274]
MEGAMHTPRPHHNNVRTLPARIDRRADQLQAAADDAALARDERNEAIADAITFDVLPFSTEQVAVLDAALRRGYIEDVYEVWNVCKDVLAAEIKRRVADADLAGAAPRFENVGCSQCGRGFGPGNGGFSHCADHIGLRALDD